MSILKRSIVLLLIHCLLSSYVHASAANPETPSVERHVSFNTQALTLTLLSAAWTGLPWHQNEAVLQQTAAVSRNLGSERKRKKGETDTSKAAPTRLEEIAKLLHEIGDAVPLNLNPSGQAVLEAIKQGERNVQRIAQKFGLSDKAVYNLYDAIREDLLIRKVRNKIQTLVDPDPAPKPISVLALNARASNVLKREGVLTVGLLRQLTERDVIILPGMGFNSLMDVKERLWKVSKWALKQSPDPDVDDVLQTSIDELHLPFSSGKPENPIDVVARLLSESGDVSSIPWTVNQQKVLQEISRGVRLQKDIAKTIGVSRDRVRVILAKVRRILILEQKRRALKRETDNEEKNISQKSIDDLDLNIRAYSVLNNLGANTIGDVMRLSEDEIMLRPNIWKGTVQNINEALARFGLSLRTHRFARPLSGQNILNEPIEVLDLNVRSHNALKNLGAITIGDATNLSPKQILSRPNSGKTTLKNIQDALAKHNLALRSEPKKRNLDENSGKLDRFSWFKRTAGLDSFEKLLVTVEMLKTQAGDIGANATRIEDALRKCTEEDRDFLFDTPSVIGTIRRLFSFLEGGASSYVIVNELSLLERHLHQAVRSRESIYIIPNTSRMRLISDTDPEVAKVQRWNIENAIGIIRTVDPVAFVQLTLHTRAVRIVPELMDDGIMGQANERELGETKLGWPLGPLAIAGALVEESYHNEFFNRDRDWLIEDFSYNFPEEDVAELPEGEHGYQVTPYLLLHESFAKLHQVEFNLKLAEYLKSHEDISKRFDVSADTIIMIIEDEVPGMRIRLNLLDSIIGKGIITDGAESLLPEFHERLKRIEEQLPRQNRGGPYIYTAPGTLIAAVGLGFENPWLAFLGLASLFIPVDALIGFFSRPKRPSQPAKAFRLIFSAA